MVELHAGPKHPLSGADPESYFDLHVLDANQKERLTAGTWHSITRLTLDACGSLALVGNSPRRGQPTSSLLQEELAGTVPAC